jgi:hypothetical protein
LIAISPSPAGYTLTSEDGDGSCHVHPEMLEGNGEEEGERAAKCDEAVINCLDLDAGLVETGIDPTIR